MNHDREPAGTVRPPTDDIRETRVFLWLFWASALLPFVLVAFSGETLGGVVREGTVLLGVAVWIHLVHGLPRRALTVTRGWIMLFGLFLALGTLLWWNEAYTFLMFGIYSLTFAYSGGFWNGLVISLVPTGMWVAEWIVSDLPNSAVATPLFVWLTANLISYFTHQVAAQNRELSALVAEISATRDALAVEERRRGTLEERARMAGEIHDTLAQGFTSIVLLSKGTNARLHDLDGEKLRTNLGLIERTARDNLAEARRLVEALRPASLDDASLTDAIRRVAERHASETATSVTVGVSGKSRPLGGSGDVVLLRAAQEALANIRKHANASSVEVHLGFGRELAVLAIKDDGDGFDPTSPATPVAGGVGGQGLGILADRVESVGGSFSTESVPGVGTTLTVRVPIATPAATAAEAT
jgi:signal transduction histidine kinase